ncbi:sensor histidine kinase [Actinoplanes auranticolor]|uniref:Sensor-like histidine kinase SenX3 n=1 Tax=Actinoplanes auranticolor TaxID=47988 RepID=A0A919S4M2_9ACTN|nr:ATP-binding protein [Actinoplanes auranticolor]GIM64207.1 hypothetical protein Aau02nite_08970 [Actinoplanes auranticolor]
MTDVTADRAQRQALRVAHAELLRSNTELEQFAAVVSHDLAAPLAVVNGYLELLGDHYATEIDAQGRKWIGATVRAVGRMQALIGNAVKYRDPARKCRVEVCARRQEDEYVVTVRDNGIGIPADQRRRVFEMFARAGTGGTAGHGVGLSTCERIVARHGGRIRADATPGGGTTISFTLPVSHTPADA